MIYMSNDIPEHYDNNLIQAHDADTGYDVRAGSAVMFYNGGMNDDRS